MRLHVDPHPEQKLYIDFPLALNNHYANKLIYHIFS